MSDKWTPGPWSYRPELHDDWGTVRAGNGFICKAKDPNVWHELELATHRKNKTDPWEANARLISAAPDMAEALDDLLMALDLPGGHCELEPAKERARAALAKARSETP